MLLPVMAATVMLTLMQCAPAKSKEAYVVKSTDGKTLTFYYDAKKASRQGTVLGIDSTQTDESDTFPAWAGSEISPDTMLAKVNFDTSFKDFRPKTTSHWFVNCNALKRISGMENLNTSEVTDMNRMFRMYSSLTELDLRSFDTRNVTNMSCMFSCCSALTKLDVSNFDTSKVIDMDEMFFYCSSLTELDLTSFDTKNVTYMRLMFSCCSDLTKLDLSNFDTRNVTDMGSMFSGCSSLTTLHCNDERIRQVYKMSGR